ncbi:MAG: hypothetical protein R3Y58_12245 [Eubacteriales bacterium]
MLDKMIHVNSLGHELVIGEGVFLNYSEIRDYGSDSKSLPFLLFDTEEMKDEFFEHFEVDILSEEDGYFEINGYKLYGHATAIKNSDYLMDKRLIKKTMTYETSTNWIKETSNVFSIEDWVNTLEIDRKEYTYTYPYTYGAALGTATLTNNAHYSADAIIKFYGPGTNPYVEIGDVVYQVNETIELGEIIEINTADRTITKYSISGESTNIFQYRNKNYNIFSKISSGASAISWDPDYVVEIILVESRGEPSWT